MRSPSSLLPRLRRPVAVLTLVATALSLTGCGLLNRVIGGDDPFDLAVGDCLQDWGGGDVESVEIVDCQEPHYAEVYQSFIIDDGPYPGEMEVSSMAEDWCTEDFADFVGVDYMESELYLDFLYPIQEGWEDLGDREILCMIYDPAGDTVGTLQNANR